MMDKKMPEVGDLVRLSDTVEGIVTNVFDDAIVVRESDERWHTILISELEPRRYDA